MDKPMTTADFFIRICNILKAKGLILGKVYYTAEKSSYMPLTTTEYGIKSYLDYGIHEGIYLDLWILIHTDSGVTEQKLGTFNTLEDSPDARRIMGELLTNFLIEERAYVSDYPDDFIWQGVKIRVFDYDGKELSWNYSCQNMEDALKKKDELLKTFPRVVIRDNATREEKSYSI